MTLLENLKKYFEDTPREQILKDWQQAGEETKDIESPTVEEFMLYIVGSTSCEHKAKVLTKEEVEKNRSNAYKYLDL